MNIHILCTGPHSTQWEPQQHYRPGLGVLPGSARHPESHGEICSKGKNHTLPYSARNLNIATALYIFQLQKYLLRQLHEPSLGPGSLDQSKLSWSDLSLGLLPQPTVTYSASYPTPLLILCHYLPPTIPNVFHIASAVLSKTQEVDHKINVTSHLKI